MLSFVIINFPLFPLDAVPLKFSVQLVERSTGNNTLARSEIKSAKTTGDRAFAVAAPVLWNALPPNLRAIDNITSFKKKLKMHIFGKAYF